MNTFTRQFAAPFVAIAIALAPISASAQSTGNSASFSTAVRAAVPTVSTSSSGSSSTNCDSPTFKRMENSAKLALKMRSEHLQSLFDRVKRMDVADMSCLEMFLNSLSFEYMSFFNMGNIIGMVMQAIIDYACDQINTAYQDAVGDLNTALTQNLRFDVDGIGTVASAGGGVKSGSSAGKWSDKPVNYSTRYSVEGTNGQRATGGASGSLSAPSGSSFDLYR